jgi:hypothetical protein
MSGAAPTGGGGFLEFFILEAGDYVEQLDGVLLGSGSPSGPDADAMQRVARALRGTATMAKIPAFADLASGIERVGRGLQEGMLRWEPALGGALVAAVDDLKILLRAARNWSSAEDQRASMRSAELSRYAPARASAPPAAAAPASAPAAPASTFLATEAANIAAGLELLTTRSGDAETAANVLRRVRALRGVAGVKEVGPLADVLEATEDAARGLESGEEEMGAESRQLLEAAAAHLRSLSAALRGDGGDVHAPSSARDAFIAALDAWTSRTSERDRVVPIADLFYGDGTPGVVEASGNPPTSAADRFRLELVSLGEHLAEVVDDARRATDSASKDRVRRELRRALRALSGAAQSFGEQDVADFVAGHVDAAEHVDFLGLAALQDLAAVLSDPGTGGERLRSRLREISGGRDLSSAIGAGFGAEEPVGPAAPSFANASSAPAPVPAPRASSPLAVPTPTFAAPVAPPVSRPVAAPVAPVAPVAPMIPAQRVAAMETLDNGSASLIDSSIAALDALEARPLAAPTPLPEDEVVPIEALLYRGRSALDRAIELRDEIKHSGNRRDDIILEELFDLLELARAE